MPSEINFPEGIFVKENNEYIFKHIKLCSKNGMSIFLLALIVILLIAVFVSIFVSDIWVSYVLLGFAGIACVLLGIVVCS
jgi:hypothetical protein